MRLLLLDIGGTAIKGSFCIDEDMGPIHEIPSQAIKGGNVLIENVTKLITSMEKEHGRADAIGICTAGRVDVKKGLITYANENIPGYTGMKVKEIIEKRFQVPAYIENDVRAAAIGEGTYGDASPFSDYLTLTYGTGIGGAIVMGKEIYRGSDGSAGEFGLLVTHAEDVVDGIPYSGCYEKYGSVTALVNKAKELDPFLSDGRKIFEHIEVYKVRKIVEEWCHEVAIGLSSLIHIFNPPCIILGGGIMQQALVESLVKSKVSSLMIGDIDEVCIKSASLGNMAGIYGMRAIIEADFL